MQDKNQVSCITINTDASFHPNYKVGGYAFYIVCDNFKIKQSGWFKKNPGNATEAEIMAIGNAMYALSVQKNIPQTKLIVINGDCQKSFKMIERKSGGPALKVYKLIAAVKKLATIHYIDKKGRDCTITPKHQFRYVKAHNGTPDARSFVNDWCDKEAKIWMRRLLRKQIFGDLLMRTKYKVNITFVIVDNIPNELEEKVIYVSTKYRTASHKCLCGCGNLSVTPLSKDGWLMHVEDEKISLVPSILNNLCPNLSHYVIENNVANILE